MRVLDIIFILLFIMVLCLALGAYLGVHFYPSTGTLSWGSN